MTTAAIMIPICWTMPMAVITESSENTMSSSRIWTITAPNDGRDARRGPALLAFELVVDLVGRLGDQEQPAREQDEIAAGDLLAEHGEQRTGQPHDPGDRQQHEDAHDHGQAEAEASGAGALVLAGACRRGSR